MRFMAVAWKTTRSTMNPATHLPQETLSAATEATRTRQPQTWTAVVECITEYVKLKKQGMHILHELRSDVPFRVLMGAFCSADGHISFRKLTFASSFDGTRHTLPLFDCGFPRTRFPHTKIFLLPEKIGQLIQLHCSFLPSHMVRATEREAPLVFKHAGITYQSPRKHCLF